MAAKKKTVEASKAAEAQTEAPEAPKPPEAAVSSQKGLGIGLLARALIVEHPDWPYTKIAEEVNAKIVGARASEKSVRWYSYHMRQAGVTGTSRVRREKA